MHVRNVNFAGADFEVKSAPAKYMHQQNAGVHQKIPTLTRTVAFSYSPLRQRFVDTMEFLFLLDTSAEYIHLFCASFFIGATVVLVSVQ
jgi:hypothetical protein